MANPKSVEFDLMVRENQLKAALDQIEAQIQRIKESLGNLSVGGGVTGGGGGGVGAAPGGATGPAMAARSVRTGPTPPISGASGVTTPSGPPPIIGGGLNVPPGGVVGGAGVGGGGAAAPPVGGGNPAAPLSPLANRFQQWFNKRSPYQQQFLHGAMIALGRSGSAALNTWANEIGTERTDWGGRVEAVTGLAGGLVGAALGAGFGGFGGIIGAGVGGQLGSALGNVFTAKLLRDIEENQMLLPTAVSNTMLRFGVKAPPGHPNQRYPTVDPLFDRRPRGVFGTEINRMRESLEERRGVILREKWFNDDQLAATTKEMNQFQSGIFDALIEAGIDPNRAYGTTPIVEKTFEQVPDGVEKVKRQRWVPARTRRSHTTTTQQETTGAGSVAPGVSPLDHRDAPARLRPGSPPETLGFWDWLRGGGLAGPPKTPEPPPPGLSFPAWLERKVLGDVRLATPYVGGQSAPSSLAGPPSTMAPGRTKTSTRTQEETEWRLETYEEEVPKFKQRAVYKSTGASRQAALFEYLTDNAAGWFGKSLNELGVLPLLAASVKAGATAQRPEGNVADLMAQFGPLATSRYLTIWNPVGQAPVAGLDQLLGVQNTLHTTNRQLQLIGLGMGETQGAIGNGLSTGTGRLGANFRGMASRSLPVLRDQMTSLSSLPEGDQSVAFAQVQNQYRSALLGSYRENDIVGYDLPMTHLQGAAERMSVMPFSPGNIFANQVKQMDARTKRKSLLGSRMSSLRNQGFLSEDLELAMTQEIEGLATDNARSVAMLSEGFENRLPALSAGRPAFFNRFNSMNLAALNLMHMSSPIRSFGAYGGAQLADQNRAFRAYGVDPSLDLPRSTTEGFNNGPLVKALRDLTRALEHAVGRTGPSNRSSGNGGSAPGSFLFN